MNNEEPMSPQVDKLALPRSISEIPSEELASDAAIDEKISGAPFPSASSVTPASDSDILNLSVTNSSAGER